MRQLPPRDRAESRVVVRYHRVYDQLIELIQAVQDLAPQGMSIGESVELTQGNGEVEINFQPKPVTVVIKDKNTTLTVQLKEKRGT